MPVLGGLAVSYERGFTPRSLIRGVVSDFSSTSEFVAQLTKPCSKTQPCPGASPQWWCGSRHLGRPHTLNTLSSHPQHTLNTPPTHSQHTLNGGGAITLRNGPVPWRVPGTAWVSLAYLWVSLSSTAWVYLSFLGFSLLYCVGFSLVNPKP